MRSSMRNLLWLAPVALGATLFYSRRKRSASAGGLSMGSILSSEEAASKLQTRYGAESNRDVVDEASWESFPASDAPAW